MIQNYPNLQMTQNLNYLRGCVMIGVNQDFPDWHTLTGVASNNEMISVEFNNQLLAELPLTAENH